MTLMSSIFKIFMKKITVSHVKIYLLTYIFIKFLLHPIYSKYIIATDKIV